MAGLFSGAMSQQLPGKVFDSASRQPLPYVTVLVMKSDRKPVKSMVTDSLGNFSVSVDTGKYFLLYTCAGFHPYTSNEIVVSAQQPNELLPVYLRRDTSQLKAVTVYGRRPIIEPSADGFVYNAENDATIAAGSAVDVLRKIPMLTVSPEGSPVIRGSTNVRVFIDNRPSSVYATTVAEALQLLPSDEIARVEIITHPSSKYDAEGTDAVINIITKKRRYDGYNGSIRSNLGNWAQDVTGTFKLRSGYWVLNTEAGAYRSDYEAGNEMVRSAGKNLTANRFQQQREWESHQHTESFGVYLTRIIDSLNTLNFGYRFRNATSREDQLQHTQVYAADTISNAFTREIPSSYYNLVHTYSGSYTGQSRNKKNEFNFLATYFDHNGGDEYDLRQRRNEAVDYREKSEGRAGNRELTLQGDYTYHFSKLSKIETGVKGTWRNTRSDNNIDIYNFSQDKFHRDIIRTNTFNYQRDVYAAYLLYNQSFKKWQLRAGGRFEETRLFARFKDTSLQLPHLSNLLPNLLARYTVDEKKSLAYSYNSQIVRPFSHFLNPNINYADSFNIAYGNPGLLPEIWHNHTLDYNINNRSLFFGVSLQYKRGRKIMEEVRRLRPDNVTETTWANSGKGTTWALSTSMRYNSNNKLNIGGNFNLQHITRTSPALNLETRGLVADISLNGSYRFKKGYTLESYFYYTTGGVNLQYTRTDYLFYNLLLTKSLLNNKLFITFRMDGFLDPWFYRTNTINTDALYQATTFRSINRYFRLAMSWRFGKLDLRTPVTPATQNND